MMEIRSRTTYVQQSGAEQSSRKLVRISTAKLQATGSHALLAAKADPQNITVLVCSTTPHSTHTLELVGLGALLLC